MPIAYFSGHQDDVFFPAYAVLVGAALAFGLPVMLWPALSRRRIGRAGIATLWTVSAALVIVAVLIAIPGFGKIGSQYAALRADVRQRYGIALTHDQSVHLIDGDSIPLPPVTTASQKVRLHAMDGDPHHYYLDLVGHGEVTRQS